MALTIPPSVQAGSSFPVSVTFGRAKGADSYVGVWPPGAGAESVFVANPNDPVFARLRAGAYSSFGVSGMGGAGTLSIPPDVPPGSALPVVVIVPGDGGTQQQGRISVAAAPAPAAAPAIVTAPTNPMAALPGADVATYNPPSPEPSARDGSRLSGQGGDVQSFYVLHFGPGALAATQYVIDHEAQLAALGSSAAPAVTLPAGVGGIGQNIGLGGSGVWSGGGAGWNTLGAGAPTTSTNVPNRRQTNIGAPTVPGLDLGGLTSNPVAMLGLGGLAFYFLMGRR